jgi:hypothetical protein
MCIYIIDENIEQSVMKTIEQCGKNNAVFWDVTPYGSYKSHMA